MSECLDTGTRDQVLGKDYGAPSDPHPQFASSAAILQEVLDTFRLRELERGTTPARAAPHPHPPGLWWTRICDVRPATSYRDPLTPQFPHLARFSIPVPGSKNAGKGQRPGGWALSVAQPTGDLSFHFSPRHGFCSPDLSAPSIRTLHFFLSCPPLHLVGYWETFVHR